MAPPPTRTVTASPRRTAAAPASVPVGKGRRLTGRRRLGTGQRAARRHAGRSTCRRSGIDAFVVVPGGVFVLSRGELWFTDLAGLRGTGLTGVTGCRRTADAGALRRRGRGRPDPPQVYAYDTGTGASMPPDRPFPPRTRTCAAPGSGWRCRNGSDGQPDRCAGGHGWVPAAASASSGRRWRRVVTTRRPGACPAEGRGRYRLQAGPVAEPARSSAWPSATRKPLAVVSCDLSSRSCTAFGSRSRPLAGLRERALTQAGLRSSLPSRLG